MKTKLANPDTIVVLGWMINNLHLKGDELLAYAFIYGYSQDGVSAFYENYDLLASMLRCRNSTAVKVVDKLIENGLVKRINRRVTGEDRTYLMVS